MQTTINSDAVAAYVECERRAYLLMIGHTGKQSAFLKALDTRRRRTVQQYHREMENHGLSCVEWYRGVLAVANGFAISAAILRHADLQAKVDFLIPVESAPRNGAQSAYQPVLAIECSRITDVHRQQLGFAGLLLQRLQGHCPTWGIYITPISQHRIKLPPHAHKAATIVSNLRRMQECQKIPQIALSTHCPYCQFLEQCRIEAEQKGDISLLGSMSGKALQRARRKGILTIEQLSYLCRPKRFRKPRQSARLVHKPELQALAIRTGKTYVQEMPKLTRQDTELFLDIEGVPAEDFYYLFGLLVHARGKKTFHQLWADSKQQEEPAFRQLLALLRRDPGAPVYHYGTFEKTVFRKLASRYRIDLSAIEPRLVNVNSLVYGRLYFPVYSNSLKLIAHHMGFQWSTPGASGIDSVGWRLLWEDTGDSSYQHMLKTYNQEDCLALKRVVDRISDLIQSAERQPDMEFAESAKQRCSAVGEQLHAAFGEILVSAHAKFDKSKIKLSTLAGGACPQSRKHGKRALRTTPPQHQKTARVQPRRKCPRCRGRNISVDSRQAEVIISDLLFTSTGCRRTTIKYFGNKIHCRQCREKYNPRKLKALQGRRYGDNLAAWAAYQRVVLRLPYRSIQQMAWDMFGIHLPAGSQQGLIAELAQRHSITRRLILENLFEAPAVHVDETSIKTQDGRHGYVWVLTDGIHVVFEFTESRQTDVIRERLSNYGGVIVSDFYAGYDTVGEKQQKCWSHLIRDINDDLWKEPFNQELEQFAACIRDLIAPIILDVRRYGLRRLHLRKFEPKVDRFYKRVIDSQSSACETVTKYQKRFTRYRSSLFTFLSGDGIPWNNNMAERALRHLAVQRKISFTFGKQFLSSYLVLLSVAQTCRFQNKSFLQFMLSRMKDVASYRERGRNIRKRRVMQRHSFSS
jgi:predicted RecB family nuclease